MAPRNGNSACNGLDYVWKERGRLWRKLSLAALNLDGNMRVLSKKVLVVDVWILIFEFLRKFGGVYRRSKCESVQARFSNAKTNSKP